MTTGKEPREQFEKLRKDVSNVTSSLADAGANTLNAAKDKAGKLYHAAKENGEDILSQAKEKIGDFEQNMHQYVRKNPNKSILFAAGIGFILSQLLRR
ncbi:MULTISPECIES: DUF883 family protein [Bartonella]|uniref:DUF883 domain-containing protein n=1 Tax=Bartonella harrusi TaxID=2961895 RepID=A0ABY5EXX5_9HYPH|nr:MULTISPECIES: DUF883 domain-containing protein [Bartonella]UNE55591.1 DUF883 domain-containing protein [Bartonella machadoae]UTO29433.1 DUF883 domain-containing protein [Bartonella harrusi]